MTQAAPQNDPNVKVPNAVRAAAARADRHFSPDTGRQVDPATAAPPNPEPPAAAPAPPVPPVPPKENFEHKYNSLKGKFDQQGRQLEMMEGRVNDLQAMMAEMNNPAAPQTSSLVTAEEEADYGSELLSVMERKARQTVQGDIDSLKGQIADLTNQLRGVGGAVAQNARDKMFKDMDERMPTWRVQNNDETFINWLTLPDSFSGVIRNKLLKQAFDANDTARVLAFFNGFLREEAATASASTETPPAPPTGKPTLESFAAPGRATAAAASTVTTEKPIITRAQISKFYADVAAGHYRGKEADKNTQEQILFLAQKEGRIRN